MIEVAVPEPFLLSYQSIGGERAGELIREVAHLIRRGSSDPEIVARLEESGCGRGFSTWLCSTVRQYGDDVVLVANSPTSFAEPPHWSAPAKAPVYGPDRVVAFGIGTWMIFHGVLIVLRNAQGGAGGTRFEGGWVLIAMLYGAIRLGMGERRGLWITGIWSLLLGGLGLSFSVSSAPLAAISLALPYLAATAYCIWRLLGFPRPITVAPPVYSSNVPK